MQVNTHFKKIYFLSKAILNQIKQWFMELNIFWKAVIILLLGSVLFFGYKYFFPVSSPIALETPQRSVELINVGDQANGTSTIPLVGIVTSVSEAKIQAESSGKLTRVYRRLGDRVVAGQVIAEFENAGERASVLQAQGVYEGARAAKESQLLNKDIQLINSATSNNTIGDTKTSVINTINSAYTSMEDIVHNKVDGLFIDPRSTNLQLKIQTTDQISEGKIINQRQDIERLLQNRKFQNSSLSVNSDLSSELLSLKTDLQALQNYLDNLAFLYNRAISTDANSQSVISTGQTNVSVSRSAILTTIAGLTQARLNLTNSLAAQEVAGRVVVEKTSSIASADANIKTAQGAYYGALARLEKTVVRSPITGTLNSLSVQTGDFVPMTSQIAVVSNNGALEVKAYVSEDDSRRIAVGDNVAINGSQDNNQKGIVTRLAGALDPITKKIEVRVGIISEKTNLINGESVRLLIQKGNTSPNLSSSRRGTVQKVQQKIKIPLSAIKITPNGAFVFTLSATNNLQAVAVVPGALMGEEIQIESGITADMQIVKDARGLKDGALVELKQ